MRDRRLGPAKRELPIAHTSGLLPRSLVRDENYTAPMGAGDFTSTNRPCPSGDSSMFRRR